MTTDRMRADPSEAVLCAPRTRVSVRNRTYELRRSITARVPARRADLPAVRQYWPTHPQWRAPCAVEQKGPALLNTLKVLTVNTKPGPSPESRPRCATAPGARSAASAPEAGSNAAGQGALRVGCGLAPHLFSDGLDRLTALHHAGRCVRGDRGGRQRRRHRRLAVHGRRIHAQPGHRAERRFRLPPDRRPPQAGVHPPRRIAPGAASLHAIPDHADGADRGLQQASFTRPAVVPLAAVVAGPLVRQSN